MFFHASNRAHRAFRVWHAEQCCLLKNLRWISSDSNQWCEILIPIRVTPDGKDIATRIHNARRIDVDLARKFITINPIEDTRERHEVSEYENLDDERFLRMDDVFPNR